MTREEAVKRVLLVVGENPITVSPNDEAYQMAQQLLDMITLDVLGMGWRFNTHYLEDGTEAIDTYVVDVDDYTTEEDLFNANFAAIPVHIQQVIVARTSYEFSLGYTGENVFSEDLSKMYLMALQQARGTEVMLSAELIDFERIYKNVASQLLNEEGWWWNTTETGEDFQTNIPLNLPPIADSYAKIKAQRLFQAYNTADVELMLNPTPEEKEIYAQMVKQNRRHFLRSLPVEELRDSYINELRAEGITSALTYDEARFSDALAASYADIKAKRMYMLVAEEVNREAYINPSQDEINLYTRLKARQLNSELQQTTYDDVLTAIRQQLLNEAGWWYNTSTDADGNLITRIPDTLPEIVEQYAVARAKRLYRAYQNNQMELILNPSPEEQELYSKMLEMHNRVTRGGKSLEQLKKDILTEVLLEGWSFNIKEQPYREIKAANLVLLKATALYPQLKAYVDKDNKIIDHKTYAEIPEETVVQVVHKVAYDELPELFKLYIDMKASRMYNYYNTINSQINSPLAWARPTADELLLFQKLKTLYAVDIENANILENDTLQYWGRRYR